MEKRNVIEQGRTPPETEKTADVVDAAVDTMLKTGMPKETDHEHQPAKPLGARVHRQVR
jgi:hypothetical protein